MGILWTLLIGFLAGHCEVLHPGPNEPSGFIITTLLSRRRLVALYLGQAIGRYQPGEGAGLIGAVVGAIVVLVVWGMFAGRGSQNLNPGVAYR